MIGNTISCHSQTIFYHKFIPCQSNEISLIVLIHISFCIYQVNKPLKSVYFPKNSTKNKTTNSFRPTLIKIQPKILIQVFKEKKYGHRKMCFLYDNDQHIEGKLLTSRHRIIKNENSWRSSIGKEERGRLASSGAGIRAMPYSFIHIDDNAHIFISKGHIQTRLSERRKL